MTEFKFFCPQCGKQIQCGTRYSGTQINCPVCQQPIGVPQAPPGATPVAPSPVAAQSRPSQNALLVTLALLVLAGVAIGGWFGYLRFKFHKSPPGLVALWTGKDGADAVGDTVATLTAIAFSEG